MSSESNQESDGLRKIAMSNAGKETTEFKKSKFVIAASVILPIAAMLCDLLVNHSIIAGSMAMVAGLISSAIASAGYSYSRGRAKSGEARAEAIATSRALSESMLAAVKKKTSEE